MIENPRPRAVLFDLDGVLVDTEPLYSQATEEVLREYGHGYPDSIKQRLMGRGAIEAAQLLLGDLAIPLSVSEYLARRRRLLIPLFRASSPIAGAPELLEQLAAEGIRLAVATSSERALFLEKTSHHPWFCHVELVVCGDDPELLAPKPAPDIFLLAARRLGVSPEDCVVVEDSPAGIRAARSAAMRVVARRDPRFSLLDLSLATWIVDNYGRRATRMLFGES